MRASLASWVLGVAAVAASAGNTCFAAEGAASGTYAVAKTMKVGGGGRWDYATLDGDGRLLYLTRTTHTQVVDAATGKVVGDIADNQLSHGVALVPAVGRGFISDGKDASVIIFDLKTREVLGKVAAAEDADGIIYDAASKKVLCACGDAGTLIVIAPDVDPKAGKADKVNLGGKPEFLAADGRGKAYVAINDKNEVAEVDIAALKVVARWPSGPGTAPTGMAIDPASRRLFVGCRNQKLVVMNADDGKVEASLPIGKGVDATAFDHGIALASCSDGTLTIARASASGTWAVSQTVHTAEGARTMAVDPKTGTVYLPTADFAVAKSDSGTTGKPVPIPGTFKVVVVERGQGHASPSAKSAE